MTVLNLQSGAVECSVLLKCDTTSPGNSRRLDTTTQSRNVWKTIPSEAARRPRSNTQQLLSVSLGSYLTNAQCLKRGTVFIQALVPPVAKEIFRWTKLPRNSLFEKLITQKTVSKQTLTLAT